MSFKSVLLLLCFALSVSALSTHHRAVSHRAVAHRAASLSPIRKRADGKRCRPRPSSSIVQNSTPVANVAPKPTVDHTAPKPPKPEPTTPKDDPTTSPKPTPKPQPATTHHEPPPPVTTKASGGGGGGPSFMTGTQTGQGTFYATGLGACGIVNKDTDYIAAVSHLLFDNYPGYNGANPNRNPMCGRKVRVTYNGKSIVVALTDRCEACKVTDLDFSPSAFKDLADFSVGRINQMRWVWI